MKVSSATKIIFISLCILLYSAHLIPMQLHHINPINSLDLKVENHVSSYHSLLEHFEKEEDYEIETIEATHEKHLKNSNITTIFVMDMTIISSIHLKDI